MKPAIKNLFKIRISFQTIYLKYMRTLKYLKNLKILTSKLKILKSKLGKPK